jgi:hypothetical protein
MKGKEVVTLTKDEGGENCILGWRQLEIENEEKLQIFKCV